jgi:hypothetical protein
VFADGHGANDVGAVGDEALVADLGHPAFEFTDHAAPSHDKMVFFIRPYTA